MKLPRWTNLSINYIHAHISLLARIKLGSAELYGTLCVADPEAHRFGSEDLDMLTIVASWLSWSVEREQVAAAFANTPMPEG